MGFMKKDKNILNHEYMEMFEKRQADIRRIADSLTFEEFVALELFYLQIRGYIICALRYKSDGAEVYGKCFHKNLCETKNFYISLDGHRLTEESCEGEWTEDCILMDFDENVKCNAVEDLHYLDEFYNYEGEVPDCLRRVKDEIDEAIGKYDEQYFGELQTTSITVSVIDVLADMAANVDMCKTIDSLSQYEEIYLFGFESMSNKERVQKYMGDIVCSLCNRGHRVILNGIGLKSPGYECIRSIINRYIEIGKVHLNPVG